MELLVTSSCVLFSESVTCCVWNLRLSSKTHFSDHAHLCRFNSQDKFGGRDYRRGPQYSSQVRYSSPMKPPGGGVRNYSTNQPNFYNQVCVVLGSLL